LSVLPTNNANSTLFVAANQTHHQYGFQIHKYRRDKLPLCHKKSLLLARNLPKKNKKTIKITLVSFSCHSPSANAFYFPAFAFVGGERNKKDVCISFSPPSTCFKQLNKFNPQIIQKIKLTLA
jgi:hypothetical protein